MSRVSLLIPARNERFLAPTVRDVLAKATGDIEVIVVLDGEPEVEPLPDDPRLIVIRHGASLGMRPAINHAARIATGDFLMKLDGHCMLEEGFDDILTRDCEPNWIVVPRRVSLDPENWTVKHTGKSPVDAHYLSYPFEAHRPGAGLHGTVWLDRARRRRDVLIDDEMSSQGSCWFMSRNWWNRLGEMDTANYGSFIQEFQEIGLKTERLGGRVKVNKRTTYAHLHKGMQYGRGYHIAKSEWDKGQRYCISYWMREMKTIRALVERFDSYGLPVPTWPRRSDLTVDWGTVQLDMAPGGQ